MMEWMAQHGIGTCNNACTTGCLPYQLHDGMSTSCPASCEDGSKIAKLRPMYGSTCLLADSARDTEAAMMHQIRKFGPIAVVIDVYDDFDTFWTANKSAVMLDRGCLFMGRHSVIVTGWGTSEHGIAYWILKNSWGPAWGDSGYFYLGRGMDALGVETNAVCYTYGNVTAEHARNLLESEGSNADDIDVNRTRRDITGHFIEVELPQDHQAMAALYAEFPETKMISVHVQVVAGAHFRLVHEPQASSRCTTIIHIPHSGSDSDMAMTHEFENKKMSPAEIVAISIAAVVALTVLLFCIHRVRKKRGAPSGEKKKLTHQDSRKDTLSDRQDHAL